MASSKNGADSCSVNGNNIMGMSLVPVRLFTTPVIFIIA
jgi:hypothetical protein